MVVLRAADQPGVLRRVAGVFEEHGVSIETLRQVPSEREDAPGASLRLITHRARQRDLDATVEALAALDVVHEVASVLRVEGN
jgi:homoserine dehydrogenase